MQLAVAVDNRKFARFLYDSMMFEVLPYWAPAVAVAVLALGLVVAIKVSYRCA
jgi:hypothetical protein